MQQKTFRIRQIIGENIRENRKRLGLTQAQLAEKTELSVQSLSALENGLKFSRMDTYCRIAEVLLLSFHSLFLAPQLQNDDLTEKYRALFFDCNKDEKSALLNIMGEVKTLIRAAQRIQGRNQ